MRRTLPAAIVILLLAAGCTGSDDPATPSPAPTRSTSIKTLVDYSGDGVVVARAGDAAKLTRAPADFKAFVVADLRRQQSSKDDVCTGRPEIHVARIDTRGWAAGGSFIPRCGGTAALWARAAGGWREVWSGQTLPDCVVLEKYGFPSSVAGTECGTADGRTRRYPA